jgi:hypothetical protein
MNLNRVKYMDKKNLKRSIIVSIVILFLSTTFLPFVYSSEGKPDLVIDDIILWPCEFPREYKFKYSLTNIGDSPIYKFQYETYFKIQWMLFGKIPLSTIRSHLQSGYLSRLLPGDSANIDFVTCAGLPRFGVYRFSLIINPNLKIEESNYDNNKYAENWKVFFGDWNQYKEI